MSDEPAEPSLTDLADAAFRKAAAKVILRARRTGTPIIVWEEGQIRGLSPDQASQDLAIKERRDRVAGAERPSPKP